MKYECVWQSTPRSYADNVYKYKLTEFDPALSDEELVKMIEEKFQVKHMFAWPELTEFEREQGCVWFTITHPWVD